jgi:hypothetical protein
LSIILALADYFLVTAGQAYRYLVDIKDNRRFTQAFPSVPIGEISEKDKNMYKND